MHFLDLKVAARKRKIDYSVPRIAHIKNQDFDFVYLVDMKHDRVKKLKFGALPVSCFFVDMCFILQFLFKLILKILF